MTLNNPFKTDEAAINAQISSNGGSTTVTVSRADDAQQDAQKLQTSLGSSGNGVHSSSVGADGQVGYQHHVNRTVTSGIDQAANSGPVFMSAKMGVPMSAADVRDHDRVTIGGV